MPTRTFNEDDFFNALRIEKVIFIKRIENNN